MKRLYKSLIIVILFLGLFITNNTFCNLTDDDVTLEFYWEPGPGPVVGYNVYLSTNGESFILISNTFLTPTIDAPYAIPITAVDGSSYSIKVEAFDANGVVGPMSEPSDSVLCRLTYTIQVVHNEGGTVSPVGPFIVNTGNSQTFTITPLIPYIISAILIDNVPIDTVNIYTFSNIQDNHTIEVVFTRVIYRLGRPIHTGEDQ